MRNLTETQEKLTDLVTIGMLNYDMLCKDEAHNEQVKSVLSEWSYIIDTNEDFTADDLMNVDTSAALNHSPESQTAQMFIRLHSRIKAMASQTEQAETEIDAPIEPALSVDNIATKIETLILQDGHGVVYHSDTEKMRHVSVNVANGEIKLHKSLHGNAYRPDEYEFWFNVGACIDTVGIDSKSEYSEDEQCENWYSDYITERAHDIATQVIADLQQR